MPQWLHILLIVLSSALMTMRLQAETLSDEMLSLILTDIYEQLAQDGIEADYEEVETALLDLHENPINLNTTDEEDLRRLFFLSDYQRDAILLFVYKQPLNDLCELRLIDCLADYEIRNMLPFVVITKEINQEPFYWQDMWHYAKQEADIRFDARNIENNGNDPFYASLKYRFKYKNKVNAGLTAERDPKEPLYYKHKIYGADFYGGWLQLNDIGHLKTLTLGDFRACFGQGLVINTNMSYGGKVAYLNNNGFSKYGLKSKTSNAEYDFLRGAGTTLRFGMVDITVFYSARKIDGKVTDGTFTSIQSTGYHQTESEITAKRSVWQQVIGANATLRLKKARIGITATENLLGDTLMPRRTYYNANYFSGTRQTAIGLNYDWHFFRMQLFGELATAQNTAKWGVANLTGLRYVPVSDITLTAVYRYYSPHFDNLLTSGFGETTRLNDEHGVLIGTQIQMMKKCRLAIYGDYFRFTYPKYGIRTYPSSGFDVYATIDYLPTEQTSMQWKIRGKLKGENDKYSVRYLLSAQSDCWRFKTGIEGNLVKQTDKVPTLGGMLYEQVEYCAKQIPLVLQCRLEGFYAKEYDSRIYVYENDVLYAYSIPMLYGVGGRWYLNIRYHINKYMSVYLKAAQSVLLDETANISVRTITELHSMLKISW